MKIPTAYFLPAKASRDMALLMSPEGLAPSIHARGGNITEERIADGEARYRVLRALIVKELRQTKPKFYREI